MSGNTLGAIPNRTQEFTYVTKTSIIPSMEQLPTRLSEFVSNDFFRLISKVIVGFLLFLEIIYFFFYQELVSIVHSPAAFINLRISITSFIILLIAFFLLGHLLVVSFTFVLNSLINIYNYLREHNHLRLTKLFSSIINFFYPINPFSAEGKSFSNSYRAKTFNKLRGYFDLDYEDVGFEIYRLAREYSIKHNKLFQMHLLEFDDSLSRGLLMNFILVFLIALYKLNFLLALVDFFIVVALIFYLRSFLEGYHMSVIDNAYLKRVIEEKQQRPILNPQI